MSIAFPRTDILSSVGYQDQTFRLFSRQEVSRTAFGSTLGKDFGSAIWLATYTTGDLTQDDALAFEAALNSLDGVIQPFEAGDLRRVNPRAYPDGAFTDSGVLASVNANNKALALSGLPAGQIISSGDYLSFTYGTSRALHQAVENVTANGSGATAQFEVRPHIRPGWSLPAAVKLKAPRGLFSLMPGSVSSKLSGPLHSVISFQAIQVV